MVAALLRIPVLPREAARQDARRIRGRPIPAIRAALEHDGQPVEIGLAVPEPSAGRPDAVGAARQGRARSSAGRPTERHGFDEVWDAVEGDQPALIGMTLSDAFFMPD